MPAFVHIRWTSTRTPQYNLHFNQNKASAITADSDGELWSIILQWDSETTNELGEAFLVFTEKEPDLFKPGAEVALQRGGRLIAILTILSDRYDNRMFEEWE